jgi:hypothetical protein
MCGGLKNPKTRWGKIIRSDGTVVSMDMRGLMSGKVSKRESAKYVLYPGDTMFIPESFAINWGLISAILGIIMISLQIIYYAGTLSSR